jgi:hypothetical protein
MPRTGRGSRQVETGSRDRLDPGLLRLATEVGALAGGGVWGAIDPNFARIPHSIRMRAADHERLRKAFPKDF